ITRVAGGLTGKNGKYITLMSTVNDVNRGVFYIKYTIDDNNIMVENPPPQGWTTETGISGRLFNDGRTDAISDNNYVCAVPPSGVLVLRFTSNNGYSHYEYVYPNGFPGGTHTGGHSIFSLGYTTHEMLLSAYFDGGPNGWILANDLGAPTYWNIYIFGELEGVASGDIYPGFAMGHSLLEIVGDDTLYDINLSMLDELLQPSTFQIALFNEGTQTLAVSPPYQTHLDKRVIDERAKLEKPWVYAGGSVYGGYPRGKIPHLRFTNRHWEKWRAMDSSYDWFHLAAGLCLQMMGEDDLLPRPR
ncbi:MAG: hypothetical protein ACWGQW_17890, partial [bacterium]